LLEIDPETPPTGEVLSFYNLQAELNLNKSQLKALFMRFLPIAHEIEALAPALAQDGPNPEYPLF
jgi:hypothetical protein